MAKFLIIDSSSGDLLQICKDFDLLCGEDGNYTFKTIHIEIWKLDPKSGTWILIINLGDRSLFLGTFHALWPFLYVMFLVSKGFVST